MAALESCDRPIAQEFDVRRVKEELLRTRPLQSNNRIVGRRYGRGVSGALVLLPARIPLLINPRSRNQRLLQLDSRLRRFSRGGVVNHQVSYEGSRNFR